MRTSHWIISLFLTASLCTASAMAASSTPATAAPLEKIDGSPAAAEHNMKDCPMQQGKKECMHKNGEPCPYDRNAKQKNKSPEKCDYKKQG